MALLLSAAFLILVPGIFPKGEAATLYPITMTVHDSITNKPNRTYSTEVAYRGILIGAMTRAQQKYKNFRFTTTYNLDYGPFLESVNGLKGSTAKHTYWQLLIQTKNGTLIVADVGIGCYLPDPEDHIIFKFTKWYEAQSTCRWKKLSPTDATPLSSLLGIPALFSVTRFYDVHIRYSQVRIQFPVLPGFFI